MVIVIIVHSCVTQVLVPVTSMDPSTLRPALAVVGGAATNSSGRGKD